MTGLCNFLVIPVTFSDSKTELTMAGLMVFKNPKLENIHVECNCLLNLNTNQKNYLRRNAPYWGTCFKMKIDIKDVENHIIDDCKIFTVKGDLKDILSDIAIPDAYKEHLEIINQARKERIRNCPL